MKDWPELAGGMSAPLRELRTGAPDVMKGFSAIARAALQAGALDTRTKELVALAIAVAIRCDACIAFHAEAALRQGASREQVLETMGMAIYMGAGPSVMYAAQVAGGVRSVRRPRPAARGLRSSPSWPPVAAAPVGPQCALARADQARAARHRGVPRLPFSPPLGEAHSFVIL
jgi:AhpD family alkylhydroperoxidase